MQLDFAYILAAGKGTRMGEIGKRIPKPIWPIFEKSLLELQVAWCVELGLKKIYINAHYLADVLKSEVDKIQKKYPVEIKVLFEDPLLDSGGCLHNLAEQPEVNYSGKILLINSDQFFFFDQLYLTKALNKLSTEKTAAVLFGLPVKKEEAYNETVINIDGVLTEIKKTDGSYDFVTYSGLGLIDLSRLKPIHGISKFFESVANYKNEKVYFVTPKKFEYWDFGTLPLYVQNIKKIHQLANDQESGFIKFLVKNQALVLNKMNDRGYLNFLNKNAIDLNHKGRFVEDSIKYDELEQKI